MAEDQGLAQQRADHVAEALFRVGIPKDKIEVRSGGNGAPVSDDWVDGLAEPSRRRVDIQIILTK